MRRFLPTPASPTRSGASGGKPDCPIQEASTIRASWLRPINSSSTRRAGWYGELTCTVLPLICRNAGWPMETSLCDEPLKEFLAAGVFLQGRRDEMGSPQSSDQGRGEGVKRNDEHLDVLLPCKPRELLRERPPTVSHPHDGTRIKERQGFVPVPADVTVQG